jgi:arylsulfatase A-like enzyme
MATTLTRRTLLKTGAAALTATLSPAVAATPRRQPNVVFVFADEWRGQATGYNKDPNVRTSHLDDLCRQSVHFSNAVAGCPVCCPYRASLLTGRYPLTHGVFMNDVPLSTDAVSLAQAYGQAGYDTAYIGKWHVDGRGRSSFTPPERRQGFQFWRALECTHNYNRSLYYADNDPTKRYWDGYDASAQTREAQRYLRERASNARPFLLVLSWGPPHDPYHTAPEKYRKLYRPEDIVLRANVPKGSEAKARQELAGYYAHIAALDDCLADLLSTLKETGLEEDTIVVFTSDHGDMLHSHGRLKKQQPWEESVCVPLLIRCPATLNVRPCTLDTPIDAPDLMPTLLGLCGQAIPGTVEGVDFSPLMRGEDQKRVEGSILTCVAPFGQWPRAGGGKEYRAIRTRRYTYARDLNGPWLLYDNQVDPCQLTNLVNRAECAAAQRELDELLHQRLKETRDEFRPGRHYLDQWGYKTDATGTVPYAP